MNSLFISIDLPFLTTVQIAGLLTILSVILFIAGINIFLVFSTWAIGFATLVPNFQFGTISVATFQQMNSFPLAAIPPFIAVGTLMNYTQMSDDIIEFSEAVGGWLPGSLGTTTIFTGGVLSAISGSNPATTAAIGEAIHQDLVENGYSPEFAAATIAAGGTVGVIIPPSVMMILYGVTFGVSVPSLFIAGIIPGILMIFSMIFVVSIVSYRSSYESSYRFSVGRILRSLWSVKNTLFSILILLGGIFLGIFTPSESASVATMYIIISNIVVGKLTLSDTIQAMKNAITLTGVILPLLVSAILVQQGLSFVGLQDALGQAIANAGSEIITIILLSIVLLITGMTLSSVPNMILTAPMLAPAAYSIGLDPLAWGVIFLMNDAIGFITPPFGINLYVSSRVSDIEYMKIARAAIPYVVVLYGLWIIFILFPEINILA